MRKKPLVIGVLGLGALLAAVVIAEKKRGYPPATRPNPRAPARTDQTVLVAASPERVWQVLSVIDQWPAWQPDILTAHLNGSLQAGTSFDWKSGGLTIAHCSARAGAGLVGRGLRGVCGPQLDLDAARRFH